MPAPPPPTPPTLAVLNALSGPLAPTVDFGQDFDFLNGLNPSFPLVGGLYNLGQAIAHRLQTPRGGLFYDLNYGTDVRGYVNQAITQQVASQLSGNIRAECLKDERVQAANVALSMNSATSTLTIAIVITTANGPFSFVFAVTSATVALLTPQAST